MSITATRSRSVSLPLTTTGLTTTFPSWAPKLEPTTCDFCHQTDRDQFLLTRYGDQYRLTSSDRTALQHYSETSQIPDNEMFAYGYPCGDHQTPIPVPENGCWNLHLKCAEQAGFRTIFVDSDLGYQLICKECI